MSEAPKDPLDEIYYTYYLDYTKKKYQLLTFLESDNTQTSYIENKLINKTYARDYTDRTIYTK